MIHFLPTRIAWFLDDVQTLFIWSQLAGVIVLSLRFILAGS